MTEQKSNRPLLIGGGALLAVAVIAGALFFGVRSFLQTSEATIAAMPPSTALYAAFDMVSVLEPGSVRTLGRLSGDETADSPPELSAQLDEQLATYGLSFEEDIQSWVGRSVGVGILGFEIEPPEPSRYLISAEIRDRGAADEFLAKLDANNETTPGEVDGISYRTLTTKEGTEVVIGRADSLMLWASDEATMGEAADALAGESLADTPGFAELLAKLPETRAATVVLTNALFESVPQLIEQFDDTGQLAGTVEANTIRALQGVATSLRITGNGIEIDVATQYDLDMLSESERELVASPNIPSGTMAQIAPENTLLYLTSAGIGANWEAQKQVLESTNEDFFDSLALLENQIGLSLDDDIMAQFTGDFGLLVFESQSGPLAEFAQLDIGLALVQQVADGATFASTVNQLADALAANGLDVGEQGDLRSLGFFGTPLGLFGLQDDRFVIVTDEASADALGQPPTLDDATKFGEAEDALDGLEMIMFADVRALLETLDAGAEVQEQAELVSMIAVGGSADIARIIVFIEETE